MKGPLARSAQVVYGPTSNMHIDTGACAPRSRSGGHAPEVTLRRSRSGGHKLDHSTGALHVVRTSNGCDCLAAGTVSRPPSSGSGLTFTIDRTAPCLSMNLGSRGSYVLSVT